MIYLTERQRLDAIALCDQILATSQKLAADFQKLKEASDDFQRDLARDRAAHEVT